MVLGKVLFVSYVKCVIWLRLCYRNVCIPVGLVKFWIDLMWRVFDVVVEFVVISPYKILIWLLSLFWFGLIDMFFDW